MNGILYLALIFGITLFGSMIAEWLDSKVDNIEQHRHTNKENPKKTKEIDDNCA